MKRGTEEQMKFVKHAGSRCSHITKGRIKNTTEVWRTRKLSLCSHTTRKYVISKMKFGEHEGCSTNSLHIKIKERGLN
jgi:hypothetical protein